MQLGQRRHGGLRTIGSSLGHEPGRHRSDFAADDRLACLGFHAALSSWPLTDLPGGSRPTAALFEKHGRQRHSAGRRSTKPSGVAISSGNMLLARMTRPRCSGVATTFLSALE